MIKSLESLEKLCKVKIYQKEASAYDYLGEEIYKEEINVIKQDLERLEELDKAQEVEFNNLKFTENENKYQTSIRVLKEAFIALGKSDIANTCWFKFLEELEKENQELKEHNLALNQTNKEVQEAYFNMQNQRNKLKKALVILKRFNFNLNETRHNNTGFEIWTDNILEYEEITQQDYELLKEVLGDEGDN